MPKISVITMGCSKNLVDSERLIRGLEAKGYAVEHDPEIPDGEYVVVNTCGFIGDAKEESINMILGLLQLKAEGKIKHIVVMGCLSQRYLQELSGEIPEVDEWYGKFDWNQFIDSLPDISNAPKRLYDWERKLTTPPWSAYIKVSEGCDRFCAFCAIPYITGRHKSRPKEEILAEVTDLVSKGVKEFNVIAQDLSSYGLDLTGSHELPALIDEMAQIEGVEWIRLHYLYPTDFPLELLDVMARRQNVCNYLDIALQHISDDVLKSMNRKISKEKTLSLLREIREKVPGIHIRTTLMTGFPGEGDKEFEELLEFVKTQKFERLGGFAYCEEENTPASRLQDSIPHKEKENRLEKLMNLQESISEELNVNKIGTKLKVLVERYENGYAVGRSEFDSPEVDQEILIENCTAEPGSFVEVTVKSAAPFELIAEQI